MKDKERLRKSREKVKGKTRQALTPVVVVKDDLKQTSRQKQKVTLSKAKKTK